MTVATPAALSPTPEQLAAWGIDPAWSRRVSIDGADGRPVNWHVFDTGPGPRGTIVCVHGNPTWAYAWKDLLTTLSPAWRVIAVDQTGMGYSERERPRTLEQRIEELVSFCRQEVSGPLVVVAHDWGGAISVGAADQLQVEALVLANTAVAKPDDVAVPPLITASRALVNVMCRYTPLFVEGTARMTSRQHRAALRAPYRGAKRRVAVRDFVADIPLRPSDISHGALERCGENFAALTCPILLLWGAKDPVFHDRFLRDLRQRAPHADVQRFADAGHLVALDEPIGAVVADWLHAKASRQSTVARDARFSDVLATVKQRANDERPVYVGPDGSLSWAALAERSRQLSHVLRSDGLSKGDRVAVLIPPSPDLLVAVCALWRCGAVPVLADASAGLGALKTLMRAQSPRYVLGTKLTLLLARSLRFAPRARYGLFGSLPGTLDCGGLNAGDEHDDAVIASDDVAAIVHTSGATGPAKAVRYSHGQLSAQRGAMNSLVDRDPDSAFTTSFAAFMLLSPLLGKTCVRPDFNINKPSTLGFDELSKASQRARVGAAWLSPASARRVVATAKGRTLPIPLVMLAGAPIAPSLRRELAAITGGAVHTPYGMTECLPVTDGVQRVANESHAGVGVGVALDGCAIVIERLDAPGHGVVADDGWGEILVSAPWLFDGYEGSSSADVASTVMMDGVRFHRTGDVGYLAGEELFVLGRRIHVIDAASGPLASVALEGSVSDALANEVAAVGVGPKGAQVVALVLEREGSLRLAPPAMSEAARAALSIPVAAVLEGTLPRDRRHQSKVDRTTLSRDVSNFLAGR